jgi:hypothetical protein
MSVRQGTEQSYRRCPESVGKPQPIRAQGESGEPFKILTTEKVRRLCGELPAAALKVWLCHFSYSGEDLTSYPKLDTIASDTNQNIETVKIARKWLRENGWLVTEGRRWIGGRFSVSIERCAFPLSPRLVFPPVEKLPQTEKPSLAVPPTEVDSQFFEVEQPITAVGFSAHGSVTAIANIETQPKESVIPAGVTPSTWKAFLEMRKMMERPLTPHGVDLAVLRLAELASDGNDPQQVVEQSISRSWSWFYELPKQNRKGETNADKRTRDNVETVWPRK